MRSRDWGLAIAGIGFAFWATVRLVEHLLPAGTDAKDVIGLVINAASAIGTVLAVVAAVWIATNANRRADIRERHLGYIAAARMRDRLLTLRGHVRTLYTAVDTPIDAIAKHSLLTRILTHRPLSSLLHFTDEELASLLGLLPEEALLFATLLEGLRMFEGEVLMHSDAVFSSLGPELHQVITEGWRETMAKHFNQLVRIQEKVSLAKP